MSQKIRARSVAAFRRATQLIPGGVNSPARAFGAVGGTPIFIQRALGPHLFDIDGNRYLDYIGSWGPMILGHAHPAVVAAVGEAMSLGSSFGAPTERESELAELVISSVPSIERVRFVSSGTEATMSALRLARGCTQRDLIIKFAGCYHGHVDSLLVQAGSAATTLGVPNSPGVPAHATQDTLVLEYNDCQALAETFRRSGDQIAAVILEPVVGNMGLVLPSAEFLAELRRLTARHGAVLIFDEVMTGFRLALGGAQGLFGVQPDLTCLGKIIGGGLPVGAYGGRADLMAKVAPTGPVYQAGTLSGNPLAMAAGITTLRLLRDHPPYAQLEEHARQLEEGVLAAVARHGLPCRWQRQGSMFTLFFTPEPVTNYAAAKRSDTQAFATFFWELMDQGIYWPCSQFEAAFLSAAHEKGHITETVAAVEAALSAVAAR